MPRAFAERLSFLLLYRERPAEDVVDRVRDHGLAEATPEWLAGLATGTVLPSPAEQRALALALEVPLEYFSDSRTTALVDAVLVLAAALRARNVQIIGPCRHVTASAQDYLALYAALLLK
ncbi:hypothetical protein [Saccharopolyspora taberi]|uniref:hypothetical protein n=1 Tax=Saccharopolyspora taberi TaxID=60895 RepID=UPI0031CEBD26